MACYLYVSRIPTTIENIMKTTTKVIKSVTPFTVYTFWLNQFINTVCNNLCVQYFFFLFRHAFSNCQSRVFLFCLQMANICQRHMLPDGSATKSIADRVLHMFKKSECCGQKLTGHAAYANHLLRRHHCEQMFRIAEDAQKKTEGNKKEKAFGLSESELLEKFNVAITNFKNSGMQEEVSSATLPPYNPTVPVGKLLFYVSFLTTQFSTVLKHLKLTVGLVGPGQVVGES